MKKGRVLVVSDSPDRRSFLEYHVRHNDLVPVLYPNIMSARKAVRLDLFFMVVVDLSIPVELKLTLVKESCHHQVDAKIITIEKVEYLKKTGALSSVPLVVNLDSIESFPDRLSEYGT